MLYNNQNFCNYLVISILNNVFELLTKGDDMVCRICFDGETFDKKLLRTPCDCIGSIGFIHSQCYRIWFKITHKTYCDICKRPFYINWLENITNVSLIRIKRLYQRKYLGLIFWRISSIIFSIYMLFEMLRIFLIMVASLQTRIPNAFLMGWFITLILQIDVLITLQLIWVTDCCLSMKRTIDEWWIDVDDDIEDEYLFSNSSNESFFNDIFIMF